MANNAFEYIWQFLKTNNCDGLDNVTDEIRCTICRKILIDPCFGCCGCKYCLACITEYLNGEQKFCPGNASDCKEELLDLCNLGHPDYPTSQKISKLIIKCPRDGCAWRCELRELEAHERVCKSSQIINCSYCNIWCQESRLTNEMMNAHLIDRNELHAQLRVECIDTLRNENESMKRDLADARAKGQEQQRVLDQQSHEMRSIKEENNSLKSEMKARLELAITNEQRDKKIDYLRQEMDTMIANNISIMKENLIIREENKSILEENKSIRQEMESMKEANNSLKSELKNIQADYSRSVESMKARDNKYGCLKQPFQPLKNNQSTKRENKSINMRNESIMKQSTLPPETRKCLTKTQPGQSGPSN